MALWIAVVSQGEIRRIFDDATSGADWITVDIEIVPPRTVGPPDIRYKARPTRPIDGVWIATIHLEHGGRTATRRGTGDYVPNDRPARNWSWNAFFENEWQQPPAEPDAPYRVCVSYRMTAVKSGVVKDSERFCSSLYDPRTKEILG